MNLIGVRVWLFLALAVGVAHLARAQVGGGEITGLVADATGAAAPGAAVTATNGRTGVVRIVVTNASGVYTLPALPPGVYAVDVMLSGFRSVRHEQVRVETGVTIRLDVTLQSATSPRQLPSPRRRRLCAPPRAWARSCPNRRSRPCRSTAAASSR